MTAEVIVGSVFTSQKFARCESFVHEFRFEIRLKDFVIRSRSCFRSDYNETYKGLVVGDNDVVFDVKVSDGSYLNVELIRQSQRLSDVKVTNCTAIVTSDGHVRCAEVDFLSGTLVAGSTEEKCSTVKLKSTWNDSESYVKNLTNSFCHNSILTISGLIIYNNPVRTTLQKDFAELMNQDGDIDIIVGEKKQKFRADKLLLSARCEFFKNMFQSNMKESCENKIELPEESPEVFVQVLSFFYTDFCPKISKMAGELLVSADKYNIEGLRSLCEEEMMKTMNKDNVCDYLVKSKMSNSTVIYEKCMGFFVRNICEVVKTESWEEMKKVMNAEMFMADIIEKIGNKEN